jgi:hypothetical protein
MFVPEVAPTNVPNVHPNADEESVVGHLELELEKKVGAGRDASPCAGAGRR